MCPHPPKFLAAYLDRVDPGFPRRSRTAYLPYPVHPLPVYASFLIYPAHSPSDPTATPSGYRGASVDLGRLCTALGQGTSS